MSVSPFSFARNNRSKHADLPLSEHRKLGGNAAQKYCRLTRLVKGSVRTPPVAAFLGFPPSQKQRPTDPVGIFSPSPPPPPPLRRLYLRRRPERLSSAPSTRPHPFPVLVQQAGRPRCSRECRMRRGGWDECTFANTANRFQRGLFHLLVIFLYLRPPYMLNNINNDTETV